MNSSRYWKVKGQDLYFPPVCVMGIINCTPDSFSDGGECETPERAVKKFRLLSAAGAHIVDIGAQSTRPGSNMISSDDELRRLLPALRGILTEKRNAIIRGERVPLISVDTFYPIVAREAVELGVDIINDVSGLSEPHMARIVAESGVGYFFMRDCDLTSSKDPINDIRQYFEEGIKRCTSRGIKPHQIALDPGVGFGTTREQEIELLDNFERIRVDDRPLVAAYSRKRVIAQLMKKPDSAPHTRDAATHKAHLRAVASGADILRVHDVPGCLDSLSLL